MKYEAHGCPIRYGLGLFGDRWSLLIIRDLMFKGRCHYGEFLSAGEGISTNILAERLERLETSGIVTKSRDPLHGKKFVYRLTDKGLDLIKQVSGRRVCYSPLPSWLQFSYDLV